MPRKDPKSRAEYQKGWDSAHLPQRAATARKSRKKHKKRVAKREAKYRKDHPELIKAYNTDYYLKNKEKMNKDSRHYNRTVNRTRRLWKFFRLTPEDWEKILEFQGRVCAISGSPQGKKKLSTDHDHTSGEVRGLLTMSMNRGLAYFNDDPILLRAAADYLENFPTPKALGRKVFGVIGRAKDKKVMIYGSENGPLKPERKRAKKRKRNPLAL